MIDIEFDIQMQDDTQAADHDDRLLDDYELAMMIDHTKAQITRQIEHALGHLRCTEHDQQARVVISGAYSLETEQLEIAYHVDTCCKPFLLQAVKALNYP